MYIIESHNLLPKYYHRPRQERYYDPKELCYRHKFTWVDRTNGRIHLETDDINILYSRKPLVLFWWVTEYNSELDYSNRKKQHLPPQYNNLLRLRLRVFDEKKASGLTYHRGELIRRDFQDSIFAMTNYPTLVNATLPASKQDYDLPTRWVNYSVRPVSNYIPKQTVVAPLKNLTSA